MTEQEHKEQLTQYHKELKPFDYFGRMVVSKAMRETYEPGYTVTQFFLSCGSTIVFTEEWKK